MGRLIEFYIPDNFKAKPRKTRSLDGAQVIEFSSARSEQFRQTTSIFPEVDADLA